MAPICLRLHPSVGNKVNVRFLFDSTADVSLIKSNVFERLGFGINNEWSFISSPRSQTTSESLVEKKKKVRFYRAQKKTTDCANYAIEGVDHKKWRDLSSQLNKSVLLFILGRKDESNESILSELKVVSELPIEFISKPRLSREIMQEMHAYIYGMKTYLADVTHYETRQQISYVDGVLGKDYFKTLRISEPCNPPMNEEYTLRESAFGLLLTINRQTLV